MANATLKATRRGTGGKGAARKLREILASRLDQSAREFHNVRNALDAREPK